MIGPRPPWWRPLARREWNRQAREFLAALIMGQAAAVMSRVVELAHSGMVPAPVSRTELN